MTAVRTAFPPVLMLVGDTISRDRRTGIHRVVVQTARALAERGGLDLVRWDRLEGRLRFLDQAELDNLFGQGRWPAGMAVRPEARNVGRPFRDHLKEPAATWLVIPEVGWHETDGVEMMSRAMAHCRAWGGRTAAVFYDLIPIRNPVYAGGAALHEAYLAELIKADLIVPISRAAGLDLQALWQERTVAPAPPITPLLLPDGGFAQDVKTAHTEGEPSRTIVLFGTVEPRKRQVQFIEAMAAARARSRETARWRVIVVGSVHHGVDKAFRAQVDRFDWLTHHDYAKDEALARILGSAAFTAFISDDEGYGLPIAESLAAGVPCLCADFGSMAEIAEGGGCLTVDVRDPAALEAAIVALCEDPAVLERLRQELRARRFRSWTDYADALVDLMAGQPPHDGADPVRVETDPVLDDAGFAAAADADIVAFRTPRARADFLAEARRRDWPDLLPQLATASEAAGAARVLGKARYRRRRTAERERVFRAARGATPAGVKVRPVFLRVLISTFNRREFVLANARWILRKVFAGVTIPVDLVVVDGGSSDGTVEALYGLRDPRLKVIERPANVGMLAGIREAARELGAEYVWLVGDDDFIDPAAFRAVLADLVAQVGAPFLFTNFAVYNRAALSPADVPERLLLEGRPVAEAAAPSGVLTVREAAAQTDNLFTAIYAIVWRADLLSAAYEQAFDGPPFASLVESIPCSEFILGDYAECEALWRSEPGIVGNAHNSWSSHRLDWHGRVMPLALRLAREAGVDPAPLQRWADLHWRLLQEAGRIAAERGWPQAADPSRDEPAQTAFRLGPAAEGTAR